MVNLHILALLGLMILVPGAAFAQTTDEFAEPVTPPAIEPEDDTVGPVGIVDELRKAHSIVTDIMTDAALTRANVDYVDEEFYLTAVWIDEKEEELVIICDPDLPSKRFVAISPWNTVRDELNIR